VLPASHLLARRRVLRLEDLRGQTWIGGAPSSAWFRIVRHACQQAGFSPRADFASDDYIAVQALVAAGLGVSVIPGLAVAHPLPGVAVRQLTSAAPARRISAAWPTDGYQGPTLHAMVECLQLSAGTMT
jgi:DNA-binding transcriptional LysR family regulator